MINIYIHQACAFKTVSSILRGSEGRSPNSDNAEKYKRVQVFENIAAQNHSGSERINKCKHTYTCPVVAT